VCESLPYITECLCRSLEVSGAIDTLCQRHIRYFEESFQLAIEHRLVHENDGKSPPQLPVTLKALVPESSRTFESAVSTNISETSDTYKQHKSEVADARSKFEQVLQASRQAAAAAAGSASLHTHGDEKLSAMNAAPATLCCQKPENRLTSSLMYNQLVCVLFTKPHSATFIHSGTWYSL